jgi:Domain of unknown function (DUF4157)
MNTRVLAQTKPSTTSAPSVRSNLLQRKFAWGGRPGPSGEYEECRKKQEAGILQRKVAQPSTFNHQHSEVPPIVHEVLRSPGQSLDGDARAFMESRFGHDFSQVRVHTGVRANESARAVNALAYTVGRDMVFRSNQYAPHSSEGRRLLAHELTHVVQARGQPVIHTCLDHESGRAEREATAAAEQIVRGDRVSTPLSPAPGLHCVRDPRLEPLLRVVEQIGQVGVNVVEQIGQVGVNVVEQIGQVGVNVVEQIGQVGVNVVVSPHAFLDGVYEGYASLRRPDAQRFLQLIPTFIANPAVVFGGISFGMDRAIISQVLASIDPRTLPAALIDCYRLLMSPDSAELAREMGRKIGSDHANEIREMLNSDGVTAAFRFGELLGPILLTVYEQALSFGGARAAEAAAQAAPRIGLRNMTRAFRELAQTRRIRQGLRASAQSPVPTRSTMQLLTQAVAEPVQPTAELAGVRPVPTSTSAPTRPVIRPSRPVNPRLVLGFSAATRGPVSVAPPLGGEPAPQAVIAVVGRESEAAAAATTRQISAARSTATSTSVRVRIAAQERAGVGRGQVVTSFTTPGAAPLPRPAIAAVVGRESEAAAATTREISAARATATSTRSSEGASRALSTMEPTSTLTPSQAGGETSTASVSLPSAATASTAEATSGIASRTARQTASPTVASSVTQRVAIPTVDQVVRASLQHVERPAIADTASRQEVPATQTIPASTPASTTTGPRSGASAGRQVETVLEGARLHPIHLMRVQMLIEDTLGPYFVRFLNSLRQQGRIFPLSFDGLHAALGLGGTERFLNQLPHFLDPTRIAAFYHSPSGFLFIREGSQLTLAGDLVHELVHAFQHTLRRPLDNFAAEFEAYSVEQRFYRQLRDQSGISAVPVERRDILNWTPADIVNHIRRAYVGPAYSPSRSITDEEARRTANYVLWRMGQWRPP